MNCTELDYEENEYVMVKFTETKIPQAVRELRYQLIDIAEKEASKLYRLAWNMLDHGCDTESVNKCREEARKLHTEITSYPERLWDSSIKWEYAFKF